MLTNWKFRVADSILGFLIAATLIWFTPNMGWLMASALVVILQIGIIGCSEGFWMYWSVTFSKTKD